MMPRLRGGRCLLARRGLREGTQPVRNCAEVAHIGKVRAYECPYTRARPTAPLHN